MIATARGSSWGSAAGASHTHSLDDTAARPFVSTNLADGVAPDPSSTILDIPPPNPPFVFPGHQAVPSSAPSAPSRHGDRSLPVPTSSPPREAGDRPRKGLALPAFSFNPGASIGQEPEPSAFLSPPITPTSLSPRLLPSPVRPTRHGHRRGGSEFIGGSVRDGNSIALMSTSPTKSESGFASAPGLAPPSRRHTGRHLRGLSGAVSAHDLSQFSRFPAAHVIPRGSSAPNSPTYFTVVRDFPFPAHEKDLATPETLHLCRDAKISGDNTMAAARPTTPVSHASEAEPSSPRQSRQGRARVGFSDKLEFIPRPLSLVSSDTSSTATARPGHSVSGSISSVVSVASPVGREHATILPKSPARDLTDSRPSTAGAVLESLANASLECDATSTSPRRRNSTPTLLAVIEAQGPGQASNNTSTARPPKRWSFFGFEPSFISSAAPAKARPSSSCSSAESIRGVSGASSSDIESDSTETGREATVPGRQPSNKTSRKKRVKGWAGSILPRKPKSRRKQNSSTAAQQPAITATVDRLEDDEQETDGSETPGQDSPLFPSGDVEVSAVGQSTARGRRPSRDDTSYPMIDLDAALGPFNTPLPLNPEWEAAQRAAGSSGKRRMHSAQGMKNFSGPGMHYHRRAESAPDLPPFDMKRSGVHRFNSNSTMADVFEEDEDEDGVSAGKDPAAKRDTAMLPSLRRSVPNDVTGRYSKRSPAGGYGLAAAIALDATSRVVLDESEPDKKAAANASQAQFSRGSPRPDAVEETPSIIFCSANSMLGSSDAGLPSPKRSFAGHEAETYVASASMAPISPRSTTQASSAHGSPRSPMSQRMSTGPSSTDKNSLQSLLMGEPGPEVRISADYDMRSVASSNSTTTRDSGFIPSQRMSQPSLREQRPVSVSSAAFGRRRSSLVSLSRLISSAHGERSKLSMEVTMDNDNEVKKSKSVGSKTKERLGRMIQFWKPNKDGAPS
ncbi:hypothetical protein L249_6923 [Ophiocordyceps polyrhachis-furcata BCC 54312]|uniref:Cell wall proline rich protein n=1 Tax=Ophiocordyceps polyrhachis-furcata BCC 54312 TaxID=1330021 RepID=A0A367LLU8_9HYPO|nr:hypothetical protein L249_6923 [Ophiocordyceps polyrhachis-furcata BCC 54312]